MPRRNFLRGVSFRRSDTRFPLCSSGHPPASSPAAGSDGQADPLVPEGCPGARINRKSGGAAFLPPDQLSAPVPAWGPQVGPMGQGERWRFKKERLHHVGRAALGGRAGGGRNLIC